MTTSNNNRPEKPMLLVLSAGDALPDAAFDVVQLHASAYRRLRMDSRTVVFLIEAVPRGARGTLAHIAAVHEFDIAWLDVPRRLDSFSLLLCDMDSTLISIECVDELAERHGCAPAVAALTAEAMSGSDRDYDKSLRERVRLLTGLQVSAMQWVLSNRMQLNPGAKGLIETAHAAGLKTGIVSGGFTDFTEALRHELGVTFAHGNQLIIEDGIVTGVMDGPLVNAAHKATILHDACRKYDCAPHQVVAVGDGANDMEMIAAAGLAVGFKPKAIVAEFADIVLTRRLDVLKYLLDVGYVAWSEMVFE